MTTYEDRIEHEHVQQIAVVITERDGDEFVFNEAITATRHHNRDWNTGEKTGHYWLICGDNTGSQQLVVWPHQIEPLIRLLRLAQTAEEQP